MGPFNSNIPIMISFIFTLYDNILNGSFDQFINYEEMSYYTKNEETLY